MVQRCEEDDQIETLRLERGVIPVSLHDCPLRRCRPRNNRDFPAGKIHRNNDCPGKDAGESLGFFPVPGPEDTDSAGRFAKPADLFRKAGSEVGLTPFFAEWMAGFAKGPVDFSLFSGDFSCLQETTVQDGR